MAPNAGCGAGAVDRRRGGLLRRTALRQHENRGPRRCWWPGSRRAGALRVDARSSVYTTAAQRCCTVGDRTRLGVGRTKLRNKEQGTGDRGQGTGNKEQGRRNKEQGTRNKEQGTGSREQGAELGRWRGPADQLRSMATASTEVARRTGPNDARPDATTNSSAAPIRVVGSSARSPNTMPPTRRVATTAPPRPMVAPKPASHRASRENQTADTHRRRPQRHPERNLAMALADICGHDGVEANGREQQPATRKDAQQPRVEPRSGQWPVEHLAERHHAHHLHVGIDGASPARAPARPPPRGMRRSRSTSRCAVSRNCAAGR